jgi:peptide/nickel transport system substrate-binding protein
MQRHGAAAIELEGERIEHRFGVAQIPPHHRKWLHPAGIKWTFCECHFAVKIAGPVLRAARRESFRSGPDGEVPMQFVRSLLLAAIAGCMLSAGGMAADPQPTRGGTLNSILWPEPPGLVLGLWVNSPTLLPATKIYEGLLSYDFNLNPQPALARSWEVSPDGLTYTFKLQPGVKWHDGKPFTADDVVFTFNEFLTEVHPRSRTVFQRTHASKIDDETVVFKLEKPFAPLIRSFDAIGGPIVPAHIYKGTDFRNNPHNAHPIGTGPFKFAEWRRGQYIHLVRNDDYWRKGMPYLDEIYYRLIPDSASRALALENGQALLATQNDIELVDIGRLKAMPHLAVETKGWEWGAPISWMTFNQRRKPFDDKRFRKAVMYALDRNFIKDTIFFGLAKVATGPIHSSSPFYDPNVPKYEYDPKKAEALLDEMGLKRDANGVRASIKLLGLPYGEVWSRFNEYVKQALKRVGIEVTIESTDVAGWGDRIRNWDFDLAVTYLTTLSDPVLGVARSYISSNIKKGMLFNNESGYSNPKVDELFAKSETTVDEAERKKIFSELQRILVDDVPVAWTVELQWPTVYNKRLHNVVVNGLGPNSTFAEVYLTPN